MASVSGITEGMGKMRIAKSWEDVFSTKNLNKIAKKLGNKWKDLGIELNYEQHHFDNFGEGRKLPKEIALAMLINYRDKSPDYKQQKQVDDFIRALKETDLSHIAHDLTEEKTVTEPAVKTSLECTEPSLTGSPEVFISYQWDKQPQIKKLRETLHEKGYTCWMDIGQMGGGDALFAEIEKGIRGCKVVISCVTNKYAESANCRKELNLAHSLKKPIIPLLLEPGMQWPPKSMGMIFSEMLYIDFRRPSVEVQNNWASSPNANQLYEKLDKYTKL